MTLSVVLSSSATALGHEHLLGCAHLGLKGPDPANAPDGSPVQWVQAPVLGSETDPPWQESWWASDPPQAGCTEGIVWRRAGAVLFGVLSLAETDFAPTPTTPPLQRASEEAYRRIFRLLQAHALPHLWRTWNYMAQINGMEHGLERYRQFNVGRQDAFLTWNRMIQGNVPTACALGVGSGPLSIAFMASDTPALPIENPRQISAYHYPSEYGPRAPTFSRAALVHPPGQELLLVSGTASIVGHQTMHVGDVVRQAQEVVLNLQALLDAANAQARSVPFTLSDLLCRVYVRHPSDHERVRTALTPLLQGAEAVYLQADVCRHDLLVEIEATAVHAL